ncbi:uncharacterized protein ATC70_002800 [Mucor velutinosus]|uniref:Secreted protein n=1 Tax=Mucor velutinosus TaxID=708070 RepID=A0AAN7DIH5_9FUNG|nr:hypothetical protein ATC70_002800 [Mucor velutinosus]
MRTHTLFAVALASFLIYFSNASAVAPVDGVLATVVPGGTGSLVGTAAGLVAPATGPSPDRKKKKRSGLPLAGALPAGIVPGLSVAGLGNVAPKGGKQSTGGLLEKRGLVGGLLGGDSDKGVGSSRSVRSNDRHGDRWDDEVTKRSNIQERDLLGGGLPVVGGLLGGGKTAKKNTAKQAAVTSGKGSRARKPSGGRGRARSQENVQPAANKASGGGLLGGGLPVAGSLLG